MLIRNSSCKLLHNLKKSNKNIIKLKEREELEEIYTVNYLQDENKIVLTDKIIIINIYLPNLIEKCYTKEVKELNNFEKYLYALAESDKEKLENIIEEDEIMKEYVKEAEEVSKGEFFGQAYDHEQADKEQEYEYGYEDGITDGIEQGIEQHKKESAINLYKNGVTEEIICKSLNITIEQLKEMTSEN